MMSPRRCLCGSSLFIIMPQDGRLGWAPCMRRLLGQGRLCRSIPDIHGRHRQRQRIANLRHAGLAQSLGADAAFSPVTAKKLQQAFARKKEVAPTPRRHETLQTIQPNRPVTAGNEEAASALTSARDRILFSDQPVERRTAEPSLLNKLELTLDIAVQAHEEQPGLLIRFWLVETAYPKQTVTVGNVDLVAGSGIKAVARIRAAYMRAKRATQRFRILVTEQEVVVSSRARPHGCLDRRLAAWFALWARHSLEPLLAATFFAHRPIRMTDER